ncbi:hypothetical protein DSO57_1017521 [Entomophthora muscae]|uniref:Uncharacterized protein n=1 Tax=Entomophthora muscae TaxID=34485 RepID=A0ACC2T4P7_9FUNG|nr:hypothetical protein DSO57_1017521 [Entomophthora muscae]
MSAVPGGILHLWFGVPEVASKGLTYLPSWALTYCWDRVSASTSLAQVIPDAHTEPVLGQPPACLLLGEVGSSFKASVQLVIRRAVAVNLGTHALLVLPLAALHFMCQTLPFLGLEWGPCQIRGGLLYIPTGGMGDP